MDAERTATPILRATVRTRVRMLAVYLGAAFACVIPGVLAAPPASASAAAAVALDAPGNGEKPLIAYDPSTRTTYVAWSNPNGPGVELCVLPAGATVCEGGAPVLLNDTKYTGYEINNPVHLGGLVVQPDGEVVVVGTPVLTGSVAWASSPGGSALFSLGQGLQNGGLFISPVSLFYTFGNAAALNDSDVALLDDYGNKFSDSPFAGSSPAVPSENSNPGGRYPRKALQTNGPELAAVQAPPPASTGSDVVIGVGDNFAGSPEQIPGCLNSAASGYGVSVGAVNGASKATGTLNYLGLPAYKLLECAALDPVLASGGQDGVGLIEEQGSGVTGAGSEFALSYRPFTATSTGGSFGSPVPVANVTSQVLDGVNGIDLAEDSGTGVYALWEDEQGTVVDYSPNGGASWEGPAVDPGPADSNNVIVGTGGGNAEIAYESNPGTGDQVFLQSVNYAELAVAPVTVTTSQTAGATTGASITVPPGTVGETDHATITGSHASTASGTVSYALYSSPSCTASSKVFDGGTEPVSAGAAAASAPVTTALTPGSYYWEAAYSGNAGNSSGVKGNDPGLSACGSEVLTVGPANSSYSVSVSESSSGVITITLIPAQPGEATIVVTIATASIAKDHAVAAKSKKCKKGQVKIKGKCLPATTVGGKASGKGSAGVPLKLKVTLSSKIRALLAKGKTEHVTATLTYKSLYGGTPTVKVYHLTVKGKKAKHH